MPNFSADTNGILRATVNLTGDAGQAIDANAGTISAALTAANAATAAAATAAAAAQSAANAALKAAQNLADLTDAATARGNLGLDPTILYPHSICSGQGTEGSPWAHADGTAGIQTCINSLSSGRGGTVWLAAGVYSVTNVEGISITTNSIAIVSECGGFNNDASFPSPGLWGSKIICAGNGIVFSGVPKLTNCSISGIYLYGPGESASSYGIHATCQLDNLAIDRVNVQAFGTAGIALAGGSDAGRITRCSVLYCGIGISVSGSTGGVNSVIGCTVADNQGIGILLGDTGYGNSIAANNIIGRNANGLGSTVSNGCNIYCASQGSVISGNQIYDAGDDIYFGHGVVSASGVIVAANGCAVTGNAIYGQQSGSGLIVASGVSGTVVSGNSWNPGGSGAAGGNSSGNVSDSGTGTKIDNSLIRQTPSLISPWAEFSDSFGQSGYWIGCDGVVHLTGTISGGAASSVMFVLPPGYRPVREIILSAANGGTSTATVFIDTSGNVTYASGQTSWVSLDGLSFPTF